VYVALNNGDGTFQAPRLVVQGFGPASPNLFVADVNGSGYGDVVGINNRGISVAIGNGDGTFQAPEIVNNNIGAGAPRFLVDLTGDGAADLIYLQGYEMWVSYNDGSGRFGPVQGFSSGLVEFQQSVSLFTADVFSDPSLDFPSTAAVLLMANV
jgi:hypothetical protein